MNLAVAAETCVAMNEINDCRGIRIRVGDTIVYPGRRGGSMWLTAGVVQPPSHNTQRSLWIKRCDTGRDVEILNTQRVAVVAHR